MQKLPTEISENWATIHKYIYNNNFEHNGTLCTHFSVYNELMVKTIIVIQSELHPPTESRDL
jgi:hypothetical protein